MRHVNFDRIAWIYDTLARLVFGKAIDRSQLALLNYVPRSGNLLVLGGGTGRFLPELWRQRPEVTITFIDASREMIRRAKARQATGQKIQFIYGTERDIPEGTYDAVLTPFYLDLYEGEPLDHIVRVLNSHLAENGQWLVADFRDSGRWWQPILLRIMYLFFRWATGIQAAHLADWSKSLDRVGWHKVTGTFRWGSFIESAQFRRLPSH